MSGGKAVALLPFLLAVAKNAGAPKRLSAYQRVYIKKTTTTTNNKKTQKPLLLDAQHIIWKDSFESKCSQV